MQHHELQDMSGEIKYPPKIPQRTYATTLNEQREQLLTDDMMVRFAASRERLSADLPPWIFNSPFQRLMIPLLIPRRCSTWTAVRPSSRDMRMASSLNARSYPRDMKNTSCANI